MHAFAGDGRPQIRRQSCLKTTLPSLEEDCLTDIHTDRYTRPKLYTTPKSTRRTQSSAKVNPVWIRSPYLDDFQHLGWSFLSKDTAMPTFPWKYYQFFKDMSQIVGKCRISQCWRIVKNSSIQMQMRFVTMHAFVRETVGQTEFSSLDRVCIPSFHAAR